MRYLGPKNLYELKELKPLELFKKKVKSLKFETALSNCAKIMFTVWDISIKVSQIFDPMTIYTFSTCAILLVCSYIQGIFTFDFTNSLFDLTNLKYIQTRFLGFVYRF